ncbi:MAG: FmdB family zinc ribbon protein [Dehalococcoidia bacterium]
MPIYQYVCSKCNTKFELRQGFNDDSVANCPKCKCEARRLFVPVPIIFKGSGFYVTDSKTTSEAQLPPKPVEAVKENTPAKEPDSPKQAIV